LYKLKRIVDLTITYLMLKQLQIQVSGKNVRFLVATLQQNNIFKNNDFLISRKR